MMLGGYQWMLASAPRLAGEQGERVAALLRARRWAAGELRCEHPDLDDAWISHLEALGLGEDVKRWREHRPSCGAGATTVRASRFTGLRPALPEPGPDWSDGFRVRPRTSWKTRTRRRRGGRADRAGSRRAKQRSRALRRWPRPSPRDRGRRECDW